jgi:hypothetical protein
MYALYSSGDKSITPLPLVGLLVSGSSVPRNLPIFSVKLPSPLLLLKKLMSANEHRKATTARINIVCQFVPATVFARIYANRVAQRVAAPNVSNIFRYRTATNDIPRTNKASVYPKASVDKIITPSTCHLSVANPQIVQSAHPPRI